jgi:nicotinamidase-related amidase
MADDAVEIIPTRTALVLLDFQLFVLDGLAERDDLIRRALSLRAAANQAGLMTIHTHVAFRTGYPEVPDDHVIFGPIKTSGFMLRNSVDSEFHSDLAPARGEVTLNKTRVSAFRSTSLDQILRANKIDRLLLAGIYTSGAVLSTVRDGADRDYRLLVVTDCCSDPDTELHDVIVKRLLPQQAETAASKAVIKALVSLR